MFLKKLVGEVLDRVDQFPDFDPRQDYAPTLRQDELSDVERQAAAGARRPRQSAESADEVELDL